MLPAQPVESLIFGALISATDPVTVLAIFSDMKADLNLCAPRPNRLFRFGGAVFPSGATHPSTLCDGMGALMNGRLDGVRRVCAERCRCDCAVQDDRQALSRYPTGVLTTGAPRCAMGVLHCAATWDLDRARTARESICCRFNPRDCQPDCDVTAIALLGAVWFFIKVCLAGLS